MKRRNFLSNSAILGASLPLGIALPALITSCSSNEKKESTQKYTSDEAAYFAKRSAGMRPWLLHSVTVQ